MASFTFFDSFYEALAEKAHNLGGDTLKVALCAAASAPVVGNSVLANLTEISYTNLSARTVTTSSSSQTAGVYKLIQAALTLTASGGAVAAFRYVVLYNDTATNDELIGFWDLGSSVTLGNTDSLALNFDGTNGTVKMQLAA